MCCVRAALTTRSPCQHVEAAFLPESGGAKPVGALRRRCKNDDAQRRAAENACSAFWKFLVGLRKSGGGLAAIRRRCFRCQNLELYTVFNHTSISGNENTAI